MKKKKKSKISKILLPVFLLFILLFSLLFIKAIRIDVNSEVELEDINDNFVNLESYKLLDLEQLGEGKNVILFSANWCGSCLNIKATLNKLSSEYLDTRFFILNLDSNRDIAGNYGIGVVPALITKYGKDVEIFNEVRPEQIEEIVLNFSYL